MDSFYIGLSVGLSLTLCVVVIALLCPLLIAFFNRRRRQREMEAMFEASSRQLRMESWNRRRELYLSFRNAAAGLVEELADGGGRWASFYLTRDLLRDVSDRGTPDAALAARQMCFTCQMLMNTGFSDELSVKFDQAVRRYDVACRDDLANLEHSSWPGGETTRQVFDPEATEEATGSSRRRFFNVLR
ncbi:MAG: hypothetical protein JSV45_07930 [Chromatiales bacterium]|nr:MAG: hypothetical protein JSV45_07930 [Chromatiales bacterium]